MSDLQNINSNLENLLDEDFNKINSFEELENNLNSESNNEKSLSNNQEEIKNEKEEESTNENTENNENKEEEESTNENNEKSLDVDIDELLNNKKNEEELQVEKIVENQEEEVNKKELEQEKVDAKETTKETTKETVDEKEIKPEVFKEFYKKITEPLKANGYDMSVDDPDKIRSLMQKGIGFNKKMESLKPAAKIFKALEENNLNNNNDVNFLIDLSKGKREAINRLLKTHKIDLTDLDNFGEDEEKEDDYQTTNYLMSDNHLQKQSILENIPENSNFTTDVKNNLWDDNSKQHLMDSNNNDLETLEQHINSGLYNTIMEKVNAKKILFNDNRNTIHIYAEVLNELENSQNNKQNSTLNNGLSNNISNEPINRGARKIESNNNNDSSNPISTSATNPRNSNNNQIPFDNFSKKLLDLPLEKLDDITADKFEELLQKFKN